MNSMIPPQMMDPYAGTCMASDMPNQQMGFNQYPPGYNQQYGNMGMPGGNMPVMNVCEDPLRSACLPASAAPEDSALVPYTPPPDVPGNYQEIGAQMGLNALTIRVHKDLCKVERIDDTQQNKGGYSGGNGGGNCCCTIENFGKQQKPTKNR